MTVPDYNTPPGFGPRPPDDRPPKRGAGTWAVLLVVWIAGATSWMLYIALFVLILYKVL